jgi:hypothetical protein
MESTMSSSAIAMTSTQFGLIAAVQQFNSSIISEVLQGPAQPGNGSGQSQHTHTLTTSAPAAVGSTQAAGRTSNAQTNSNANSSGQGSSGNGSNGSPLSPREMLAQGKPLYA